MPATPDYTLIQFMRGEKYAVETAIPESGEPLLDLDSGTLYYGNGKDRRGIPVNTGACIKLESPVDLNDLVTWGKYFIEGKVQNLPEGVELYNKLFLSVEGSAATDAVYLCQTIHILDGDSKDQGFTRSSIDSGQSWSEWKTSAGSSLLFDPNGGGTIDKDPAAGLDKYVLSSQNFIQSITDGPEGTEGKSGFLLVYRKDLDSPYIYQQLVTASTDGEPGHVYCRLSVDGNTTWNAPGYGWREMDNVPATETQAGVVKLYNDIDSTATDLAATAYAVKLAYDKASTSDKRKYVIYVTVLPDPVPEDLAEGGLVVLG